MIDGSVAMVLVGAAIQALPPMRSIMIHFRRRPEAVRSPRSARSASMMGEPART